MQKQIDFGVILLMVLLLCYGSLLLERSRQNEPLFPTVHREVAPFELSLREFLQLSSVNLNDADKEALMELPGIGDKIAESILEYRAKHGPFQTVEQLMDIDGIAEKRFAQIEKYIYVE